MAAECSSCEYQNTNGRLAISALAGLLVNDEMVGGRERVTTDEERVLRGD